MIVDITNEVLTQLKTLLPNVTVLTAYPETAPSFPCVIITENSNTSKYDTVDTSGNKFCDVSLEINIFCTGKTKMSDAKAIRNSIDGLFSDTYRMGRVFSDEIPNYIDTTVYRYLLRYEFSIDGNRTIYKR